MCSTAAASTAVRFGASRQRNTTQGCNRRSVPAAAPTENRHDAPAHASCPLYAPVPFIRPVDFAAGLQLNVCRVEDLVACPAKVTESDGVLGKEGPEVILKVWIKPTAGESAKKQSLDFIEEDRGSIISWVLWGPLLPVGVQHKPSDLANSILKPLKQDHEFADRLQLGRPWILLPNLPCIVNSSIPNIRWDGGFRKWEPSSSALHPDVFVLWATCSSVGLASRQVRRGLPCLLTPGGRGARESRLLGW